MAEAPQVILSTRFPPVAPATQPALGDQVMQSMVRSQAPHSYLLLCKRLRQGLLLVLHASLA